METPRIIYIPGYREENKKKFPGFELQQYCNNTGKKFARILMPGETRSLIKTGFSGSAIKEQVTKYLSSVHNIPLILNVYSLSCREVAESLLDANSKVLSCIQSVNFIHPNMAPLYSIKVMDWATNRELAVPLDEDEYLYGKPTQVFNSLMKPVGDSKEGKGNPEEFQRDLQTYRRQDLNGDTLESKINKLKDKGISCNIETSEKDQIINPDFSSTIEDPTKRLERRKISAIGSHRPSKETMENIYTHIEGII